MMHSVLFNSFLNLKWKLLQIMTISREDQYHHLSKFDFSTITFIISNYQSYTEPFFINNYFFLLSENSEMMHSVLFNSFLNLKWKLLQIMTISREDQYHHLSKFDFLTITFIISNYQSYTEPFFYK